MSYFHPTGGGYVYSLLPFFRQVHIFSVFPNIYVLSCEVRLPFLYLLTFDRRIPELELLIKPFFEIQGV